MGGRLNLDISPCRPQMTDQCGKRLQKEHGHGLL